MLATNCAFDWCANGPVSVNTTSGRYIEDMRLDVLIDVVGAGNLGNVPLLKRVRPSIRPGLSCCIGMPTQEAQAELWMQYCVIQPVVAAT